MKFVTLKCNKKYISKSPAYVSKLFNVAVVCCKFFFNLALKLFVTFLNAVKFCDVIVRKLIAVVFY
jgi:hypothetical protein